MKIESLVLGLFETNCYVLGNSDAVKDCLIVDAGLDSDKLVRFLHGHELNPSAVVLTHGHVDHTAGILSLREDFPGVKVFIHRLDGGMLTGEQGNLSELAGVRFSAEPADSLVEEGEVIEQAGMRFEVLHTPGHTQGGISLYSREAGAVLVGDTLFAGSIGRTDFPGADFAQLMASITTKLFALPGETVVYPGHGPATTIAQEKAHNPFVN